MKSYWVESVRNTPIRRPPKKSSYSTISKTTTTTAKATANGAVKQLDEAAQFVCAAIERATLNIDLEAARRSPFTPIACCPLFLRLKKQNKTLTPLA